jgi:hypothetical protein
MPNPKSTSNSSEWYRTERNTEALMKAVMSGRHVHTLSGDDLWCLIRLTWITAGKDGIVDLHWQLLKAPAIAHLLKTKVHCQ